MQALLEQRIKQARSGRELWIRLFGAEVDLKTDEYILLLPETGEINKYMMTYLLEFLAANNSKHVIILYESLETEKVIMNYEEKWTSADVQVQKIKVTTEEYEEILHYYCMYQFTGRLVVGSLDKPEGRTGRELLNGRFTLEEMVKHYIYDIRED